MRLLLFFPFFAILLTGCFTPSTPDIPAWVQQPPAPTATTLYGVSVAENFDTALVSATGNIAVTVLKAAQPALETAVEDPRARKTVAAKMQTVLETIRYPDIEVEAKAEMGEEQAVLIRMPRARLASQLADRLQTHREQIETRLDAHRDAPDFMRLGTLGRADEERPMLLAEITLLETADPAADTTLYRALSQRIETEFNALKFGASLTVISDANAIVYVEPLKKALRAEGIAPSGSTVGMILLFADSEQVRSGGRYTVKTRLRLESTAKGKQLAHSEHFLQGSALSGYDDARRQTGEALGELIEKEGLFHTLGF